MIRAVVTSCVEGVIKRLAALGLMEINDREYLQHYGFTSRPLAGAEVILVADGNHIVAIASDDRRYRISLESGECALYDDQGQQVHLKRGKEIIVTGCDKLTVTAAVEITLTAPVVKISQDLQVGNNITAAGDVSDKTRSMAQDRAIYNAHTHKYDDISNNLSSYPNSTTKTPDQQE